jgi:hypothetical protein
VRKTIGTESRRFASFVAHWLRPIATEIRGGKREAGHTGVGVPKEPGKLIDRVRLTQPRNSIVQSGGARVFAMWRLGRWGWQGLQERQAGGGGGGGGGGGVGGDGVARGRT